MHLAAGVKKKPGHASDVLALLIACNRAGKYQQTLHESERLLKLSPQDGRVHLARADALRLLGRLPEAAQEYAHAARKGQCDVALAWRSAGLAAQQSHQSAQAMHAYQRALRLNAQDSDVLGNMLPIYSEMHGGRPDFALPAALRLQAQVHEDRSHYYRAAQTLKFNRRYQLALSAYDRYLQGQRMTPEVMSGRLEAEQFACLWERVEASTDELATQVYGPAEQAQTTPAAWEKNLMHFAWCMNEAWNLQVLRASLDGALRQTRLRAQPFAHDAHCWPSTETPRRLRIGYVSWDFFDHATLHLLGGVLAAHDRSQVEVFAYDYSPKDKSRFRRRFLESVEHVVDIGNLSDIEAAERIVADKIDILVDLKGNTQHARLGIFAMRPAPLQVTWLGFPGSSAMAQMDYVLGDAVVTPDSSAAHYPEKFCRLPDTYQPNDYARPVGDNGGTRADWGLPEQAVVFCSFNQSYKIDRLSFETWMKVLRGVPNSVLWLLDPGLEARQNLEQAAQTLGIAPQRLVFATKVATPLHMARLCLADMALDTRVYNGHTTTSDALWMGLPVLTAPGTHFASRVSASLLRAAGMPELIAPDMAGMAQLAIDLALNPERLQAVRAKLQAQRFIAPLYDTERFTRHLERAYAMMAERAGQGLAPAILDVPALPARTQPFATQLNISATGLQPPPYLNTEQYAQELDKLDNQLYLVWPQPQCPLCASTQHTNVQRSLWAQPLGGLEHSAWAQCEACNHVYTRDYWSAEGLAHLAQQQPLPTPSAQDYAASAPWRAHSAQVVSAVVQVLGGHAALLQRKESVKWIDVYNSRPWLLAAVREWGCTPIALARTPDQVAIMATANLQAATADFLTVNFDGQPDVLSLMGVLEQEPFADLLLTRAANVLAPGGVLVLGFDNAANAQWTQAERAQDPGLWNDPRRLHWFGTKVVLQMLQEVGLHVVQMLPDGTTPYGVILLAQKGVKQ